MRAILYTAEYVNALSTKSQADKTILTSPVTGIGGLSGALSNSVTVKGAVASLGKLKTASSSLANTPLAAEIASTITNNDTLSKNTILATYENVIASIMNVATDGKFKLITFLSEQGKQSLTPLLAEYGYIITEISSSDYKAPSTTLGGAVGSAFATYKGEDVKWVPYPNANSTVLISWSTFKTVSVKTFRFGFEG